MAHIYGGQANGLAINSRKRTVWVLFAYGRAVVVEDGTPGATKYRRLLGIGYRVAQEPWLRRVGLLPRTQR